MEQSDYQFELANSIKDMEQDMAVLSLDLPKCYSQTAAARRARVLTIKIQKDFRRFRKYSCLAGLK